MSLAEDYAIPLFVSKLFRMLQCTDHTDVIEWDHQRKGFKVKCIRLLENKVLPKYFRHGNYTSFVRQLNMYDFHKVRASGDEGIFSHDGLTSLDKDLLCKVKRKCYRRDSDKENATDSTPIVRFCQPLKTFSTEQLIDQLVQSVRRQVEVSQEDTKKIIYQKRKEAKYREIKGSKYLPKIYCMLGVQQNLELQELSIEQTMLFEDKLVSMNSLAYLQSEAVFVRVQTQQTFD